MADLTVHTFRLTLSSGPGEGQALAARLKNAVAQHIARGLQDAAPPDPGDGAVLHIRRLTLSLDVLGDVPVERIARALGRQLAGKIANSLARPNGHSVVFPSTAAHRAGYIAARLERPSPARPWWFSAFSGLAQIPPVQAARTLLAVEPAAATEILRHLPQTARMRFIRALQPTDIEHLLDVWAYDPAEMTPAERAAGRSAMLQDSQPGPAPADVFARVLALAAGGDGPGLSVLAATARILLSDEGRDARPGPGPAAAPSPFSDGPGDAPRARDTDTPDTAAPGSPRSAGTAPGAGKDPSPRRPVPTGPDTPCIFTADFANLALLVAMADAATAGPAPNGAQVLALLAVSAGPETAQAVWHDAAWRMALGVPRDAAIESPQTDTADPATTREIADPWLLEAAASLPAPGRTHQALAQAATDLLARFAWRLPGFAASSPAFLWGNLLNGPGRMIIAPDTLDVEIARAPLDILLVITGMGAREARLSDGRVLRIRRCAP